MDPLTPPLRDRPTYLYPPPLPTLSFPKRYASSVDSSTILGRSSHLLAHSTYIDMIEMEADSSNRELRPNTNIISSEAHQSSAVSADEKGAREGSSGHAEDPNLVEPTTVTKEAEHPARSSEDAANYPTGVKLLAIAVALCFAVFCVALDSTSGRLLGGFGWPCCVYLPNPYRHHHRNSDSKNN